MPEIVSAIIGIVRLRADMDINLRANLARDRKDRRIRNDECIRF